MFNKLFGNPAPAAPIPGPYSNGQTNFLYQLLFCDNPDLFRAQPGVPPPDWQQILFSPAPDALAIRGIAEDRSAESRVRMLAYGWLKQHGHEVPKGELLGAIVEVGLEGGLDVLAVYTDARLRYINQTGKLAIFEAAPPDVAAQAAKVLAEARRVVAQIGPWDRPRLPAPSKGTIRMSFLVSDGLYFGQGPWPAMSRDPIAARFIAESSQLLKLVVDTALAGRAHSRPQWRMKPGDRDRPVSPLSTRPHA